MTRCRPGSTMSSPSTPVKASCSAARAKLTLRRSPAASVTRAKPFSSLTGRVTLACEVAHVELHDLVGRPLAHVRKVHADDDFAVHAHDHVAVHAHRRTAQAQLAELEARVGEAVAERPERQVRAVHVVLVPHRPAAGGLVGVVQGHLPDVARHGHRQLAARAHVTEEHLGDRLRAGFPGYPGVKDGSRQGGLTRDGQWAARDEHDDDRGPGGCHGCHQLGLAAREAELAAVARLAAGAPGRQPGAFTQHKDGHARHHARLPPRPRCSPSSPPSTPQPAA